MGWVSAVAGGALALAIIAPGTAFACTLLRVRTADEADMSVYFTRFEGEDTTDGKYRRCRLVREPAPDTRRFFVTPFRQDANTIVHRKNWPR